MNDPTLPGQTASLNPGIRRHGIDWKLDLLNSMGHSRSPRVLTARDFHRLAEAIRPGVSAETAREVADGFEKIGALKQVNQGLYLNRRITPPAQPAEAAQHVRSGAWVSLHHVLGNVGAHNNPTSIVTAVVPSTPGKRLNLGLVPPRPKSKSEEAAIAAANAAAGASSKMNMGEGQAPRLEPPICSGLLKKLAGKPASEDARPRWGVQFHFLALDERFFPGPSSDPQLRELAIDEDARCPTFTPEAALLQWIHLAGQHRSTLSRPPHGDIEFLPEDAHWSNPGLRKDRLLALADRWDLSAPAQEWIREHDFAHHEADEYYGVEGAGAHGGREPMHEAPKRKKPHP